MGLLTAGYWAATYWVADFWADDYWPEYAAVEVPSTGAAGGELSRTRLFRRAKEEREENEIMGFIKEFLRVQGR